MAHANLYAHVKFPPYEFIEFPKWLDLPDGSRVLAQNAEEEAALLAAAPEEEPQPERIKRAYTRRAQAAEGEQA